MRGDAQVVLTLRLGEFGEKVHSVAITVSERLARDLMEPMELSDEPMALFLASPGLMGGKGDAVTARKRKFVMRKEHSKEIAAGLVRELEKLFGTDDQVNGYREEQWSDRDRRQADYVRGRNT